MRGIQHRAPRSERFVSGRALRRAVTAAHQAASAAVPASPQRAARYNTPVRILISAGEASGEMYGAELIRALRRHDPTLEFFGVGGERMREASCDTVVDARDLAVVGITEILGHLPRIYSLFH